MRLLNYLLLGLIESKNEGNGMITVIKRISRDKNDYSGTKGKIYTLKFLEKKNNTSKTLWIISTEISKEIFVQYAKNTVPVYIHCKNNVSGEYIQFIYT